MSGALTLDELTAALESMPPEAPVVYVGGNLDGQSPGDFDSWRGFYALPALEHGAPSCTVSELLPRVKAARYATYQGYKGGYFQMDGEATVHVDNYGCWTHRYLAAVRLLRRVKGDVVRLVVKESEGW